MHWHETGRFRQVCPLLHSAPNGWRCSVAAVDVRPFWGRAFGVYTGLLLLLALFTGGVSYGVLRLTVGPGVSLPMVFWPGRWPEIRTAQARAFQDRAAAAISRRAYKEAVLALASSLERDPDNYEAALLLAQISEFQENHEYADRMFLRLLQDFPDRHQRTAVVYHDTLLALGRTEQLAAFSLRLALTDTERVAVWVRSLLLALRSRDATPAFFERNRADIDRLPEHAARLVRAVGSITAGDEAAAVKSLREFFPGPWNPVYIQQQISLLMQLGRADAAEVLLLYYSGALSGLDQTLLAYAIDQRLGRLTVARDDFRLALRRPGAELRSVRLAAALIDYPDRNAFAELNHLMTGNPARRATADPVAMWLAALSCDATLEADLWATEAHARLHLTLPPIRRVNYASRSFEDPGSPGHLINTLPLDRELIYLLVEKAIARPRTPGR